MVERIKKHAAILSLLVIFGIPFVLVPGFAGMFIKIGSIDGEAVDSNHTDWISLDSVQFNVKRTITQVGGGSRDISNPGFSELTITKEMDKSSPLLFFEAVAGTSLGNATFELTNDNNKGVTYFKIELEEAIVSSYSTSSSGDRPTESVTLNFTKIAHTYVDQNSGQSTTRGWDIDKNEPYVPAAPQ